MLHIPQRLQLRIKAIGLQFVLCIIGITLQSCLDPDEFISSRNNADGISETEKVQPSQTQFDNYVFDQDTAQFSYRDMCAIQENGYYLIANNILLYYDISSDALFPLCTKTSCRHNGKGCNAYVYWADNDMGTWVSNCDYYELIVYDDSLYAFSRDDNWDLYLCQYKHDFTQKEQLARLTDSTAKPRILTAGLPSTLIKDGWFYFLRIVWDTEKMDNLECDTSFTLCRVRLEKEAIPEELYTFEYATDYDIQRGSEYGVQILSSGTSVYCVAAMQHREYETMDQVQQRIIRFNEESGAEMIWTYTGDEKINFFDSPGEGPFWIYPSCMSNNEELIYMSGTDSKFQSSGVSVSAIDLKSQKSKVLYRTPYRWIEQLRTDGSNYYFIEVGKGQIYLTAIDGEGNLIRRYPFSYTKTYEDSMKERNISQEDWISGNIRLLITDKRYIAVSSYNVNVYEGLSADIDLKDGYDITTGIGLILTDDFLSGKKVEIKQIYAFE